MYRMLKLIPSRRRPRRRRPPSRQLTLSPRAEAALAVALFTIVGAALVAEGGGLRVVTLVLVGAGVTVSALLGWPASGHAALAAAALYLILETLDSRMDAAHAPLRLLVAVAIVLAVLAGGRLRREAARPRRAGATTAPEEKDSGARPAPGSLAYELQRAERHGRPVSLLVVRPDNLEHLAASGAEGLARLLDVIGQAIAASVRTIDVVSRRGEHRFELVLPETDATSARTVAERIRLQVDAARPEVAPGRLLGLAVSVGIAAYPADGADADMLIDAAERALARAVDLGGNRTVLHSVPPGAPKGWAISTAGPSVAK
jgi:diguanylate cyclase (GGDEF)-like protein